MIHPAKLVRPPFAAVALVSTLLACAPRPATDAAEAPDAVEPGPSATPARDPAAPSLAAKYKDYFPIGAAVDANTIRTHAPLITQHFDSITTEKMVVLIATHLTFVVSALLLAVMDRMIPLKR